MDSSGNIRHLTENERPRVDEIAISTTEAHILNAFATESDRKKFYDTASAMGYQVEYGDAMSRQDRRKVYKKAFGCSVFQRTLSAAVGMYDTKTAI